MIPPEDERAVLEVALEAGRMGTFDWNIRDGVIRWSHALERLHGLDPGTFDGTWEAYRKDIHPDDLERVMAEVGVLLAGSPKDHHLHYRIVRPDGQVRWIEAFGRYLHDEAGKPIRLLGVCCDVTERKLQEKLRDDMLAMLSHDLRNPLGAIVTSASALRRRDTMPPEKTERLIDIIGAAAERMNRWIADLLDLVAIDAGGVRIDAQPHDATALVAEIVELFGPTAGEKEIALMLAPDCAGDVRCDRERILQVLANLVGNAVKFTPPGGRILVACSVRGAEVIFSVTDDGPGIGAEEQERIFDRYWRSERAHGAGLGLGLSIARDLVEAHGGRIWVDSEPGAGATFRFAIPRVNV